MRAVARLTLFYIVVFAFFLLAGASVAVMADWLKARYAVGAYSGFAFSRSFLHAASENAAWAAYASALLVPPAATGRKDIPGIFRIALICLLAGASLFSVTKASGLFDLDGTVETRIKTLRMPGMTVDGRGISIAFLAPDRADGVAVIAPVAAPLKISTTKEAEASAAYDRRVGAFFSDGGLASIERDFSAATERLRSAGEAGTWVLLAYSFALAALLAVVGSIFWNLFDWPLAGIALCALAYRGVLILDGIIGSGPLGRFLETLELGISRSFIAPAALAAIAISTLAIGGLLSLARGKADAHG